MHKHRSFLILRLNDFDNFLFFCRQLQKLLYISNIFAQNNIVYYYNMNRMGCEYCPNMILQKVESMGKRMGLYDGFTK